MAEAQPTAHPIEHRRYSVGLVCVLLTAALLVAVVVSTLIGAGVSLRQALSVVAAELHVGGGGIDPEVRSRVEDILWNIRLPRVVLGALVGAALGVAGAVMQGLFRNPMAGPFVVGVSSGAGLGAAIALKWVDFWLLGFSSVPVLAFVGASGVTILVYVLSRRGGEVPIATLLLTGIAVGSLCSALTAIVIVLSDAGEVRGIVFWLMGRLSLRFWDPHVKMMLPYALVGIALTMLYARDLNVLSLGDESAQHLGLEVRRTKLILLLVASLLAAGAVAVSGVIAFVGLVVPHLMRLLVGPDHRGLIPASALGGAALLVVADLLARMVLAPAELPVGIMTSLLGCPFFLYLLHRRRAYDLR